jgi:hypothetical protein
MAGESVIEIILRAKNEASAVIAAVTRDVEAMTAKVVATNQRMAAIAAPTMQAGFKGDWYSADFAKFEAGLKNASTSVTTLGKNATLTRTELSAMMQSAGVGGPLPNLLGGAGIGTIGAGVAVAGVAMVAAKAAIELGTLGQQVEQTQKKFEAFTGGPQQAAAALAAMRGATEGGLSAMDAMTYSSMLLSMGLAKNGDEAAKITRIAAMLGPSYRDAGANIQDFTMLLANQSVRRLDQFGLSVDAVKAKQAELVAGGMDSQLAFTNAVLEIGAQKMDLLAAAGVKAATSAQQLTVAWADMRAAIGVELAPGVGSLQGGLAGVMRDVSGSIQSASDDPQTQLAGLALRRAELERQIQAINALPFGTFGTGEALTPLIAALVEVNKLLDDVGNKERRASGGWTPAEMLSGAGTYQPVTDKMRAAILAATKEKYTVTVEGNVMMNKIWLSEFKAEADKAAAERNIDYSGGYTNAVMYEQALKAFDRQTLPGAQRPQFDFQAPQASAYNDAKAYEAAMKTWQTQGLAALGVTDKIASTAITNLIGYRSDATSTDQETQAKITKEATQAWKEAAAVTERQWTMAAGVLMSVAGSPGAGASAVTPADMALSKVGLYQEKPDEKLRQLEDAVKNTEARKKYPGLIDSLFGAAGVGALAGGNQDMLMAGFLKVKEMWESGALFADPANLKFINKGAVDKGVEDKLAAEQGKLNYQKMMGLPAEGTKGATDNITAINMLLDRMSLVLPGALPGAAALPGAKPATAGELVTAPATQNIAAQNITVNVASGAVLVGGEASTGAEARLKTYIVDAFRGFAQAEQRRAPSAPAGLPGNP